MPYKRFDDEEATRKPADGHSAGEAPAAQVATQRPPAGSAGALPWYIRGPLMPLLAYARANQGAQYPGQDARDVARSFANYATAGGADPLMAQIGQREPGWTPSWAQLNPDVGAQQAQTAAARKRLGALDTAVEGGGLLTLAEFPPLRSLGVAAAPTMMGGYRGAESLIQGERDPTKVAKQVGRGVLEGGVPAAIGKYVVGPLASMVGKRMFGAATPESIAEDAAQARQRAESARAQLADMPVPGGVGFTENTGPLAGSNAPTVSQLQDELTNLGNMKGANDPSGLAPILAKRINAALGSPEVQTAQTIADQAARRAERATQLSDWVGKSEVKGMNVPGQALDYLKEQWPNLSEAERQAYGGIANTAGWKPSRWAEIGLAGAGGLAGHAIEHGLDYLGMPVPLPWRELGAYGGMRAAEALGGESAQRTQQAILDAYPALTGATPGGLQAKLWSDQVRQALTNLMTSGVGASGY